MLIPSAIDPASDQKQQEWFEVFFDLVFAVAVGIWAERLSREVTVASYARAGGYLLPIWWVWLGQTAFATRFPAGSVRAHALSIVQIAGVASMATELAMAQPASIRFPLGFVAARLALLGMYAQAARRSPEARAVARVYFRGFGAGAAIWAISVLLPLESRPWAWGLGLAVDFATPWLGRSTLKRVPADHHHLAERVSLFNSLLLYVAIEGIVRNLAERSWTAETVARAVLAFVLVVTLWWIYAARVNRADLRGLLAAGIQPYLYSQFLVVLGVGTCSIAIRVFGREDIPQDAIALLAGGVLLWIGGVVLIRALVLQHRDRYWHAPFIAALVLIPVLAAIAPGRPLLVLALLDVVVLGLLAIELRHGEHTAQTHRR